MKRLLLTVLALLAFRATVAAEPLPRDLEGVGVDEQLGSTIDLTIPFVDETGRAVTLADYVRGDVPVLLTLNYFGCPLLCGLQLNALNDALKELEWAPGQNFRVVTVSFDPDEGPTLASQKRASHLEELGRGDVDWHFLTGTPESIAALTSALGYTYRYIETQDEFAHPAAMMLVSPTGVLTRYLYGLTYTARDLRLALVEAGEGRVGTAVDHFVLSCYVYDASAGSYVRDAMLFMRLGGAVTVVALGLFLFTLWRREARSQPTPDPV